LAVAQWKLVQEGAFTYLLRVSKANSAYVATDFEDKFTTALGLEARVVVEFVDTIPSVSGGKYRSTICKQAPPAKGASA
jgi:hypothetical protein